jgi:hypothetical protein
VIHQLDYFEMFAPRTAPVFAVSLNYKLNVSVVYLSCLLVTGPRLRMLKSEVLTAAGVTEALKAHHLHPTPPPLTDARLALACLHIAGEQFRRPFETFFQTAASPFNG